MHAIDQCINYFYSTKEFRIQFLLTLFEKERQFIYQISETTVDASYANQSDRKNNEGYTFNLFNDLIN